MKEYALKKINEKGRNPNNVFRVVRKMKIESQILLEESACEEMLEHITLLKRIEENSVKSIYKKI